MFFFARYSGQRTLPAETSFRPERGARSITIIIVELFKNLLSD